MSLCNNQWFFNPYTFETQFLKPTIFQTINSVWSNILSLKYQRVAPSDGKDIRIRKFEFVAKTQFLCIAYVDNCLLSLYSRFFWLSPYYTWRSSWLPATLSWRRTFPPSPTTVWTDCMWEKSAICVGWNINTFQIKFFSFNNCTACKTIREIIKTWF